MLLTATTSTAAEGVTPLGYVETHYAYNFNRPANGITNYRGFDNRHDTFTLANVALGANAEYGPVTTRVILQVGATPSTYYLGEPALAGAGGANASNAEVWKYVQEANVSWKAPVGNGLLVQAGLFPSPIGPEVFAVKDNWNYSRSNLFFGFPYYHTGIRATYEWTDRWSSTFAVFNGWNTLVDNNGEKSIQTNVTYKIKDELLVQALYFGGVERPSASRPEGPWWRHDFDVFAEWDAAKWFSIMAQANHGWEPNRIGTARWTAGALYARFRPADPVYIALRADRFHEHLATDDAGGRSSTPIFWGGAEWVSSATATLDVRPVDHLSIRTEVRHDAAETSLFFASDHAARSQNTFLLGATAWF